MSDNAEAIEQDYDAAIDHEYDVFIVYSQDDRKVALHICEQLERKGLRCITDWKDGKFKPGEPVFHSIVDCIEKSKTTLLILTQNSHNSSWVTLETILAFERSQNTKSLVLRLLLYNVKSQDVEFVKKGLLKNVPNVSVDFNKENWVDSLVLSVNKAIPMPEMYLQVGCLAHGQVFSHFTGYLVHVLPVLAEEIAKNDIFRNQTGCMSTKYYIMLPGTCKIHDSLEGYDPDTRTTITKEGHLHTHKTHAGKERNFQPTIYKATRGHETFYFIADFPNVLNAMYTMKDKGLADIDIRYQITRFYYTLNEVVNHIENKGCNDTVRILPYNENVESMPDVIFNAVRDDVVGMDYASCSSESSTSTVPRTPQRLLSKTGDYEFDASVSWYEDSTTDNHSAEDIIKYLESKDKKLIYGHRSNFEYLQKARWNIFVISRESLVQDGAMIHACTSALHCSVNDNRLTVLPVLVDVKPADIPRLIKWVTLVNVKEPCFKDKLLQTMNGGNITVRDRLPSGDVAPGLAWAYLINYLPVTIFTKTSDDLDFHQRIRKFLRERDIRCGCLAKVLIIVPSTCTTHPNVQDQANVGLPRGRVALEYLGHIDPVVQDKGGQLDREFKLHMYKYTGPDRRSVCFLSEYCTPINCLHEMANTYTFAGLLKADMYKQAEEFVKLLNDLMHRQRVKEQLGDLSPHVHVMHYDDQKDTLMQAFDEALTTLQDANMVYKEEHNMRYDENNPLPTLYHQQMRPANS